MDKVAEWKGLTQTHDFSVDVYHDTDARVFVAKVLTSSPATIPDTRRIPGKPPMKKNIDPPDELRHENLNELRNLTKQHITNRCGKILQFERNEEEL